MFIHTIEPERRIAMEKDVDGYFFVTLNNVAPDCRYFFCPEGEEMYPDPASNFQPEGVHGCSQVVDHDAFQWTDEKWRGHLFRDFVMYELHVGTFTEHGTFEAVIPRLKELRDCGINAIELMPVSQFPGSRNWGYDGVFPYAVQNSYGGPSGLKKLVDACHQHGIAVILDVVYNHLGPEGNYLPAFGPYFTNQYCTPWGDAINFDGEWSDAVRDYFANNALYWFKYYHIDALRLDAVHMVFDQGAVHFWQYLHEKVQSLSVTLGRSLYLIAESDLNAPKIVRPVAVGGYAFTAQWLDDFHHALYVILDKNGKERYEDFGSMAQLAKAYKEGFVHSGEHVRFRKRKHGVSSAGVEGEKFIVFTSNHDQIGNRPDGARLSTLVDFERLKIAAAALLLSPCIPMLFMGDEYGERNPFHYFISHSDPELIEAVRKGRKEEFRSFNTDGEWTDPLDENTFRRCILNWEVRQTGKHAWLHKWYKTLIWLRNTLPALKNLDKNNVDAVPVGERALMVFRRDVDTRTIVLCIFNFSESEIACELPAAMTFRKILDSRSNEWIEREPGVNTTNDQLFKERITVAPLGVCLYQG